MFCVLTFIRKDSGTKNRYVDAGVVLGGRHDYGAETVRRDGITALTE
jgi:hypothetical protein